MAERTKDFPLSITIRTVDRATAGLKRINDRLERTFAPTKRLGEQFRSLHENLRLPQMAAGFRGIGGMVRGLATQVGIAAGVAGLAAVGFKRIVDEFDQLGDTADKINISVNALAQLRFAAEDTGAEVGALDLGLLTLSKNVGQLKAGTGSLHSLLKKVSPTLLKQVKGAKSSEEAFGLLADATAKLEDPTKQSALAAAAFGRGGKELLPLLKLGSKGVAELRAEFAESAGDQEEAARQADALDKSFRKLSLSTMGIKASILGAAGPAVRDLSQKLKAFFDANRSAIGAWVRDFGEKLPGRLKIVGAALSSVFSVLKDVVGVLRSMVQWVGGTESAVKLLVEGFLVFKGLQLVGHLAGIAQGFIGIDRKTHV